mmetsp:Transcript_59353/g.126198  ORF Transcript_59353/g.126198 Transcript_59353/m.126198 type:complete len:115 (-) Transcript_59353:765-1109(-)
MSLSKPKNTAEEGWWMEVTMVFPSSLANWSRIRINATALVLSNPLVGSSNSMMAGSVRSSLPMFTLFFSPPEIMNMGVSAHFCNRSWCIILSTSATFLALCQFEGSLSNAVYVN